MSSHPSTQTDKMTASTCAECSGCRHTVGGEEGDWCYMFRDAPTPLPCTQHDKYEPTRQLMTQLIRRKPEIIPLMVLGHLATQDD